MKQEQQKQAQDLYFQTDLNKSQIAQTLGVSRRSLHYWIKEQNWDRIKKNAEYMPSLLTENLSLILGHYMDDLLTAERQGYPATSKEINDMYKLTLTINKLKGRSAINQSMEAFGWLQESIFNDDPALAAQVQPYIDKYISSRAAQKKTNHMPGKFDSTGHIPTPATADKEYILDLEDLIALDEQKTREKTAQQQSSSGLGSTPPPQVERATPPPPASKLPASQRPNSAKSLREQLRGTASSGPGKAYRERQQAAA